MEENNEIKNDEIVEEIPKEEEDIQLVNLKKRIPYDEDLFEDKDTYLQVLNDLLEDSKFIALEILYPYEDYSKYDLEKRYYNWQLRACVELFNLADRAGITNYSENGISWSKLSDGLSEKLLQALTSKVGIPKRKENNEDENV